MKGNNIIMHPSADGVEIVTRQKGEQKIIMYINHNAKKVVVDSIELEPFECRIVG